MGYYVTAPERNAMRKMRADGTSIRALCALYPHRSCFTVYKHVRDVPIPPNLPRSNRKCDPIAALRLREQGLTWRAIGDRFKMSGPGVFMSCQRYLEKQEAQA
jgi:hypothetical protein